VDKTLFSGYFQPYVNAAWAKYGTTDLKIDTQAQWGVVTGRVSPSTGLLTFPNVGTFAQPSAIDIFSCSTGPFGGYPVATRDEMGAIGARLAAAFNRSTLVANPNQPDAAEAVSRYYQTNPTNHYARIVHGVNLDGRGYAFPYDDVVPSNNTAPDQAGTVFDGSPDLLTVTVGGPDGSSAEKDEGGDGVVGGGNGKAKKDEDAGDDENKEGDEKKKKKMAIDFSGLFKKVTSVLKGMLCM
jgi:hypothetical protein